MNIHLLSMTTDDFEHFLGNSIKEYAEDKVAAGTWNTEESMELSKQSFNDLLPDGLGTMNQYLLRIVETETNEKIGYIWFKVIDRTILKEAFIYDFIIFESFRGKGYGKATMAAVDVKAKKLGVKKMSLHVFGNNQIAIDLYHKSGYIVTDLSMSKTIF